MLNKKTIILLFSLLLYQSPLLSKSNSFDEFNSKNLSKYFSGIVAFENKKNSEALDFFESSKILINQHDRYLERFVMSLVFEGKVAKAINVIKSNQKKKNSDFFEAYILLALDSLKKKSQFFYHLNSISERFQILMIDYSDFYYLLEFFYF